jgi:DNA-binding MarR family transcriptional regulator
MYMHAYNIKMEMLSNCTCSKLRQLTRKITGIYDRHLLADELTVSQYSLLSRIGKYGPLGVIPLANYMGMDRSTMSRNLKPLIAAGWIETVDLPLEMLTDKRSFGLRLSVEGKRKWHAATPHWRRAQDEIDAALGEQTHQELVELIDRANGKFEDF